MLGRQQVTLGRQRCGPGVQLHPLPGRPHHPGRCRGPCAAPAARRMPDRWIGRLDHATHRWSVRPEDQPAAPADPGRRQPHPAPSCITAWPRFPSTTSPRHACGDRAEPWSSTPSCRRPRWCGARMDTEEIRVAMIEQIGFIGDKPLFVRVTYTGAAFRPARSDPGGAPARRGGRRAHDADFEDVTAGTPAGRLQRRDRGGAPRQAHRDGNARAGGHADDGASELLTRRRRWLSCGSSASPISARRVASKTTDHGPLAPGKRNPEETLRSVTGNTRPFRL